MKFKKLFASLGMLAAAILVAPQAAYPVVSNPAVQTVTGYGNGSNTNFTITFDFRSNLWVTVNLYDTSTTPATVTSVPQQGGASGFSVTGGNPGTTVVMGTAPTATQYLVIGRAVPLTQPTVFSPASIFPYQGLSAQLDQITLALQNLNGNFAAGASTASSSTFIPSNYITGLTGDISTSLGSGVVPTTIATNAVTNSKFRQSSGLAVLGTAGTVTANIADILGSTDKVLRVDTGGSVLGFGSINLASSSTVGSSRLPRANIATSTASTLVVNDSSGNLSVLAGGTSGNCAVFNGTTWTSSTCTGAAETVQRATITFSAGTPSVSTQGGTLVTTWIDSLTDNGTGDTTVNIHTGTFTSAPSCTCTPIETSGRECLQSAGTAVSTSVVRFLILNTTFTASDSNFNFICVGPH